MPLRLVFDGTPALDPTFAHSVSSLPSSQIVPPSTVSAPSAGRGVSLDASGRLPIGVVSTTIAVVNADPTDLVIGQIWYRQDTSQLCIRHDAGTTKRVTLA